MSDILYSPQIDALATLAEEVTRSTQEGVKRFVEPGTGTLRRAKSHRHHIVFGRRGSGKTSLLIKAADDLAVEGRPIAFIDLEPFKGHAYPDVLISVLIASFSRYRDWIGQTGEDHRGWRSLVSRFLPVKSRRDRFDGKLADGLSMRIAAAISELQDQLTLPDDAELQRVAEEELESSVRGQIRSGIGVPGAGEVSSDVTAANGTRSAQQLRETYRRSKIDFLRQHILEYQQIFRELSRLSGGSGFLFLDDLYYIPRSDQAQLLDYFHGIGKGNELWLKIGTIRHRSEWYVHGNPPSGLKLGDDADDIDLDLTLESYAVAKRFLTTVLRGLVTECSAPILHEFMAPGAIDRLVLASGGVARDFLGIFWRSINEARERLQLEPRHHRGPKIGAEDVNLAAGKYGDIKMDEFRRDTLEDRSTLEDAFGRVTDFCLNRAKANCFLMDQDPTSDKNPLIQELVDLRLVHLVRSRVTVSGRAGKAYKAYMLDVSQYTGSRKRRGFEMVEFWRKGSREQLRRISLIYEPSAH